MLFHCALGLSLTSREDDAELAVTILQSLLDAGYMRHDCHLALAKLFARHGFAVRARRSLRSALQEDPLSEDARDFERHFDAQVKRGQRAPPQRRTAAIPRPLGLRRTADVRPSSTWRCAQMGR